MKRWFQSLKKELLSLGIVSIALGAVMIIYPETVSRVMCYVIGGLLIFSGGFTLISVLAKKGVKPFTFRIIPAALAVAVGFLFVFGASFVFDIIWVFIGIGIIMNSYFKNSYAYELKYSGNPRWWSNLVISMISLALGIILILKPAETQTAMIVLTGIFMAIDGLGDLASTFIFMGEFSRIRKIEKAEEKERKLQEKLTAREKKIAKKLAKKNKKNAVVDLNEVISETKVAAETEEAEAAKETDQTVNQ